MFNLQILVSKNYSGFSVLCSVKLWRFGSESIPNLGLWKVSILKFVANLICGLKLLQVLIALLIFVLWWLVSWVLKRCVHFYLLLQILKLLFSLFVSFAVKVKVARFVGKLLILTLYKFFAWFENSWKREQLNWLKNNCQI